MTRVRTSVVILSAVALAGLALSSLASAQTPAAAKPVSRLVRPVPPPDDLTAPPADAEKTPSGLVTKVLTAGTGSVHPTLADRVKVEYTGWNSEGLMFDSTFARAAASNVTLRNAMAGWIEGMQKMVVGEKRRFWVPEKLAFNGAPGRPKGTVVFDVELLGIEAAPQAGPQAPPDVAAPPSDAEKTKSGLATKVLKPGTGTQHPTRTSTVTVHYSGWTTDGKLFDSSVVRGQPASFPLDRVIAGWTEGVQLMVVGETRRMWIPEKLAYQGQEGRPKGMLVFDVELLDIK